MRVSVYDPQWRDPAVQEATHTWLHNNLGPTWPDLLIQSLDLDERPEVIATCITPDKTNRQGVCTHTRTLAAHTPFPITAWLRSELGHALH